MTYGMTDIHQHLLWGLDDGAASAQEMQEMLREAARQGITKVAATCHICPGMQPFDEGLYRERLAEAQAFCREQGLPVQVVQGAEAAWTYQTVSALRQGRIPLLGDTDCVLLELWQDISLTEAKRAVQGVISAGYCPVLAHVERYRCFAWFPQQTIRFREETGARLQMNAGTLLHPRHGLEKRFVRKLLDAQALDAVASDAHGTSGRRINLLQARDWLERHTDAAYTRELLTFMEA